MSPRQHTTGATSISIAASMTNKMARQSQQQKDYSPSVLRSMKQLASLPDEASLSSLPHGAMTRSHTDSPPKLQQMSGSAQAVRPIQ
ncbi:hypothetical protein BGZ65_000805, partial [Modicella reniformis]